MTSQGKKKQTTEAKGRDERQWMEKINTEKGRNHRTRHRRREKAIAYHFFRSFRCPPTSYMRNLLPSIWKVVSTIPVVRTRARNTSYNTWKEGWTEKTDRDNKRNEGRTKITQWKKKRKTHQKVNKCIVSRRHVLRVSMCISQTDDSKTWWRRTTRMRETEKATRSER